MEYKWNSIAAAKRYAAEHVLILVLMEYKWNEAMVHYWDDYGGLNPCFNGIQMERFVL